MNINIVNINIVLLYIFVKLYNHIYLFKYKYIRTFHNYIIGYRNYIQDLYFLNIKKLTIIYYCNSKHFYGTLCYIFEHTSTY